MLLQSHRPTARGTMIPATHRQISGRIAPHHGITVRLARAVMFLGGWIRTRRFPNRSRPNGGSPNPTSTAIAHCFPGPIPISPRCTASTKANYAAKAASVIRHFAVKAHSRIIRSRAGSW